MYDSKEYIKKIEDKYYREIELTVKRMYEFNKRLSKVLSSTPKTARVVKVSIGF